MDIFRFSDIQSHHKHKIQIEVVLFAAKGSQISIKGRETADGVNDMRWDEVIEFFSNEEVVGMVKSVVE